MPTPSFSKDITAVFNSSQLRNSLKQDITCRLVCDILGVSSVSMLIYDAREDQLISRGSFLAPSWKSNYKTVNVVLQEVIDNIMIFEFFDSQLYERNLATICLADFKRSILWSKPTDPPGINESIFQELKEKWMSRESRSSYRQYKQALHSEAYSISQDSISGSFFSRLLLNRSSLVNDVEIKDLGDTETLLGFHEALKTVSLQLPEHDLYYIGLPLFATERYTGILRLGVSSVSDSVLKQATTLDDFNFKQTPQYERLNNFAQLISLHMKTEYYLAGYRAFSHMKIDISGNFRIEERELRTVCDTMAEVINCNGCIIRFSENKDSKDPPIKATSNTLNKYSEYIRSKTSEESRFSEDIYTILKYGRHHSYKIVAIIFSITDIDKNSFATREFYYDNEGNIKAEEVESRIFADFTPSYNRKLLDLGIQEVLILPIDDVDEGIIILTNTQNRFFTSSDVEMGLLASKRLQLEIKLLQGMEQQRKEELQRAQISGMNIVLHQFGQVIKSSSDTMEEISDRLDLYIRNQYGGEKNVPDEFSKISTNLRLLGFLIKHSQNQILRANRITQLDSQPIVPKRKAEFDLNTFLKNKCKDFDPYARVERGLHIWLTNSERRFEKFETDIELLTEVIYNLLDNAVKYSFDSSEMRAKGISFEEHSFRSEGNILVDYATTYDHIAISVNSWGPTIPKEERQLIFEKTFRGSNSKNVVGTGIGLFLCKKIMTALGGGISVESTRNKTTFTISLKR
jgi:signal transduction histidine kinase